MPSLHPTTMLTSISRAKHQFILPRATSIHPRLFAPVRGYAQGYGDGKGDPKGESPMEQGKSNKTKENAEHPGPAAPADGQGGSGKTPEDASSQSGGARSKEAEETGSSPTGGSIGHSGGKNDASAKIHDNGESGDGNTEEKKAEVEKHNEDFEKRHDRAQPAEQDKVDEKFWSGKKCWVVGHLQSNANYHR